LGRGEEALEDAEQSRSIAQRLGHRGWTVASHRALGIARQAIGDLDGAEAAFARSLNLSAHWPLFRSWASARSTTSFPGPDTATPSHQPSHKGNDSS
jgi:hypothetical protein